MEKCKNQQRSRINKAFKKILRFDGTNPSYCFDWLEQTEALVNEHQGQIYREELLLNCGTSVSKMIHALPQGATNQNIKDAVLRNHSNLRTVLQQLNAYHQLHQKPDEALQTYNTRYASFFNLAYPELEHDNPLSRMHCIHYASSLYGKLGDEMTGRFNQDLPENLQTAFEKATNFEPRIITKQSINNRKIHEVNHINIGHEDEVEINEAHVRNLNYKGKNYALNYAQNRSKTTNTTNNTSNHQNNTTQSYGSSSQHNNSNPRYRYNKSNKQEKPVNVSVTLHGPVSKEQLYKIQEVLRHPSQYRDRIKPEDCPVKGEYVNAFNKFHPKKVEVNEATVEEAIKYGHFLKKSEEDITEAIDIYKTDTTRTHVVFYWDHTAFIIVVLSMFLTFRYGIIAYILLLLCNTVLTLPLHVVRKMMPSCIACICNTCNILLAPHHIYVILIYRHYPYVQDNVTTLPCFTGTVNFTHVIFYWHHTTYIIVVLCMLLTF